MTMESPIDDYRAHAEFRARESAAGIGAAVTRSGFSDGGHVWDCIVTDGREWHFVRVLGSDLGPYPDLSAEDVEEGIERLAATLPAEHRITYVIDLNPLHIDRDGNVSD
jgi:hypothetical protein